MTDLSGFKFAGAATANLPTTGNQPVDSIRRASELGMLGRTETLIVPPPPTPATDQAGGSGVPPQP